MTDFFKELYQYNQHYNQLLIREFVKNKDLVSDKSILLLSHILNAHHIWNGSSFNGLYNLQKIKLWLADFVTLKVKPIGFCFGFKVPNTFFITRAKR